MSVAEPLVIRNLATGVPGLDTVMGGGLCEYAFNLIAGPPGAGKTTLVQQILFANATPERPALYFTVLGEPTIKMIRYQRQFTLLRRSTRPVGGEVHQPRHRGHGRRPRFRAGPHRRRGR